MSEAIIEEIRKVNFKKGDVLFMRTREHMTDNQYSRIREGVEKILPEGVQVLLCEGIDEIGVIRKEES